ncbi:helix-turn-helix transcriptional regulator [Pseudonocardia saturnea]
MPHWTEGRSSLGLRDYERAFAVLDRCAEIGSVGRLQEELLEALGSVYGYRDTAFFRTTSFTHTVDDPRPVTNGKIADVIDEYRDGWWTRVPQSLDDIRRTGLSALVRLDRRRLPETAHDYLENFLFRRRIHALCALDLELPAGNRGIVALIHEDPDRFTGRDLAGLSLIVRQLSAVSRHLPDRSRHDPSLLGALTPRLREIADLVGQGHGNQAIARRTGLSLDTVKKYVSKILVQSGCRNRTEIALLAARLGAAETPPADRPGAGRAVADSR